jgi:hypothetical protein
MSSSVNSSSFVFFIPKEVKDKSSGDIYIKKKESNS